MTLYDSRAANAPSPRMRRAKTPFARCPCTKNAICAGAVNHLNHTNCVNHSSDKCQPALIHALTPVNPFHPPQKASSPACARPPRPRARPSPAARLPSCAQNFSAQTLVNSRPSLVNALLPLQPLHPPPKGLQRALYSPAATTRAAFTSLPSAILRPKFLAQSHTFSRKLSCNAHPSRLPVNPSIHPQNASNLNPLCNRNVAGQSHNSIVAVSPALTQSAIRNSAPNLLLPPCKSLDHRIRCTHSRKSKATANHLCTLTNVYCLTAQPQLQDHTAPDATRCAHPQNFFGESKVTHEFTRQFAPIRYSPHAPTGYKAGHHMISCRALTRSAPVPRRRS